MDRSGASPNFVIIHDDEAAWGEFVVQRLKHLDCRFIHIPIKAEYCQPLDRRGWQRVFEPAHKKPDLLIK